METPFLVLLEQAELAAAARVRAARAEAENRLARAAADAQSIDAGAAELISAAVVEVEQRVRVAALQEVAAAERAVAAIDGERPSEAGASGEAFERAVAQVVAAVLGENPRR